MQQVQEELQKCLDEAEGAAPEPVGCIPTTAWSATMAESALDLEVRSLLQWCFNTSVYYYCILLLYYCILLYDGGERPRLGGAVLQVYNAVHISHHCMVCCDMSMYSYQGLGRHDGRKCPGRGGAVLDMNNAVQ